MAASKLTAAERTARARIGAHESWANTADRSARTKAARNASPASVDYWLDKVDPDGVMGPEARRQAAEAKRNAYMARLVYNRHKARRERQAAATPGESR